MCANCIEVLKRALAVANAKRRPVARAPPARKGNIIRAVARPGRARSRLKDACSFPSRT
jgi:hypothetical protein